MPKRHRTAKQKEFEAEKARLYRKTPEYKQAYDRYRGSEKYTATRRRTWYKNKYHVTFEEFEAQIKAQNGMCPIGNHPFGPLGKGGDSPCLDHDHETGENRSIICSNHNAGLGKFHDSIAEMESGLSYLKHFKGELE